MLPEGPWADLAVDIIEVTGHKLLVVVDNYSRWPEVILLSKPDSQHVITGHVITMVHPSHPMTLNSFCDT